LSDQNRARTGTTTTVGRGESLVEIQMHDIEAHIARPDLTQDRVHIGPIVIQQASRGMDQTGYLFNILFKQSQRIGVGKHDTCNGIIQAAL
jgi:hypothetical protein